MLDSLLHPQRPFLQEGRCRSNESNGFLLLCSKKFEQFKTILYVCLRFPMEGEYDPRFNLSGQGLMPMAEVNNSNSLWKQVLSVVRE